MASRERAADLAPPVRPRGDVDAGYEAVDQVLVEALYRLLYDDRKCVILVLVADEDPKYLVSDGHCTQSGQ
jgi:hypothetical protein